MKIRPIKNIAPGRYRSSNNEWYFVENKQHRNNPAKREWWVYQRMQDGKFYSDTPYFFESYPTLKSLIKALEKAKP